MIVDQNIPVRPTPVQLSMVNQRVVLEKNHTYLGTDHDVITLPFVFLDRFPKHDFGLSTRITTVFSLAITYIQREGKTHLSAVSKKFMPRSYACFMHSKVRSEKLCQSSPIPSRLDSLSCRSEDSPFSTCPPKLQISSCQPNLDTRICSGRGIISRTLTIHQAQGLTHAALNCQRGGTAYLFCGVLPKPFFKNCRWQIRNFTCPFKYP